MLSSIVNKINRKVSGLLSRPSSQSVDIQDEQILNVIQGVIDQKLTYLEKSALLDLVSVVIENESNQLDGIIIETGCALGGSAIVLASAKHKGRKLAVYDVFGMIPPPSARDEQDIHERYQVITSGKSEGLGDQLYYGYEEDLYGKVSQSFSDFGLEVSKNNIDLIKGLYEDTLAINSPVALAHIDCDWYDSVFVCLSRIEPYLIKGGTLIIDDYAAWSGCRKAVDEYFKDKRAEFHFLEKSRLHIIRK